MPPFPACLVKCKIWGVLKMAKFDSCFCLCSSSIPGFVFILFLFCRIETCYFLPPSNANLTSKYTEQMATADLNNSVRRNGSMARDLLPIKLPAHWDPSQGSGSQACSELELFCFCLYKHKKCWFYLYHSRSMC